MATTQTYSSNYAGIQAMPYVAPSIFAARSLSDSDPLLTIHESVPGTLNVTNVTTSGTIVKDRQCDWDPTGTITKSDTTLVVSPFETQIQPCFSNLYDQWEIQQRRGSNQDWMPTDFIDFVALQLGKTVGKRIEQLIYVGDKNNANEFDGLYVKLASNDVQINALTSANIVAELDKVRESIPDDVYVEEDYAIRLSIADFKKYQIAVQNGDYRNLGPVGSVPEDFRGIPLKVAFGQTENNIIAGRTADLHFGTNLKSELSQFGTYDMREQGEDTLRIFSKYDLGTAITNRTDIVWADTSAV